MAIHEFGKDLEAEVGKLQYLAVLVFSAYASGLFMVITNRPIGAEALLPVGASGMQVVLRPLVHVFVGFVGFCLLT